jgi:hypothetical protein
VAEWPGTDWAREAKRALARLDARPRRFQASLRAGYEYDDNVVLRGSGVALPSEISSQRDERAAWLLQAGGQVFRRGPWSAGLAASYEGWVHGDLEEFDLHYPAAVGWLDRRLGERTTLRLAADVDYAWLDGDPFGSAHGAALSLFESFGRAGTTELGARFWRQNYFFTSGDVPDGPGAVGAPCLDPGDAVCGPPALDEGHERNRDGEGVTLALLHGVSFAEGRAYARIGYRYHHFGARGREYSYDASEWIAELSARLPARFELRLAASYADLPYRHPSTFPDPDRLFAGLQYGLSGSDRHDWYFSSEVALARPISSSLTLSGSWRYQRNRSNVEVFAYERNVLGVYLTVGL